MPIYRTEPTISEVGRISVSFESSGGPFYFVAPHRFDIRKWARLWPDADFRFFSAAHFASVEAYSRWLLTIELYQEFSNYDFILICQTDAILWRKLDFLSEIEFDYIGAPWDGYFELSWNPFTRTLRSGRRSIGARRLSVGNGGLSLRRTQAFLNGLPRFPTLRNFVNEDQVISYFGPASGIRVSSRKFAESVFMETGARSWKPGDLVPMVYGFHGLERFNTDLELELLFAHRRENVVREAFPAKGRFHSNSRFGN